MVFHQPHNSKANYNYNAYFYTDKIWDFHFHKNFELIYVIKGSVNCTVNNKLFTLCAEDFGLCLPYDIHRYEPSVDTVYWVLVFSEDFVRYFSKFASGKMGNGFSFKCDEVVKNYIKQQIIDNTSPSTITLKSCLYAVCEQYINSVELIDKDLKKAEVIAVITDYIQNNHTDNLSLKAISAQLGYDYNYMSRYFRKVFNMTFSDFVNTYRIETAIKLLEDTDKSIAEIALESGFQSIRNFNNFFKSITNTTPSEYRKASRK